MLVLLHFYELGYTPFSSRRCSSSTSSSGSSPISSAAGLPRARAEGDAAWRVSRPQIVALGLLGVRADCLAVGALCDGGQALSGIAKDLTKMSSKSAVKLVVPDEHESALFKWVAILTGSKNALKGVGFFVGGLLLRCSASSRRCCFGGAGRWRRWCGRADADARRAGQGRTRKAKFRQMFSNNRAVNMLAAARLFLFAARDVWFVVGLPVFLARVLGWYFWQVGGFMALWVIGYGVVQAWRRG